MHVFEKLSFLRGNAEQRCFAVAAIAVGTLTTEHPPHRTVVVMRVEDYYPKGKRWWVRLHEKGGKRHEMPAHHNLEAYLDAYIEAAGIRDGGKSPLFRSAVGRTGALTATAMNRVDAWRMIQRRAAELGTRSPDRLPYLPRHRHHRLPGSRRHVRERTGHGRAQKSAHDKAL